MARRMLRGRLSLAGRHWRDEAAPQAREYSLGWIRRGRKFWDPRVHRALSIDRRGTVFGRERRQRDAAGTPRLDRVLQHAFGKHAGGRARKKWLAGAVSRPLLGHRQ